MRSGGATLAKRAWTICRNRGEGAAPTHPLHEVSVICLARGAVLSIGMSMINALAVWIELSELPIILFT